MIIRSEPFLAAKIFTFTLHFRKEKKMTENSKFSFSRNKGNENTACSSMNLKK